MLGSASRRVRDGEDGMTIVELMVATVVLLVGVLGMLSMLDTANGTTSANLSREQGNTLARDVVERARQIPYASLAIASAPALFRQALPDGPATANADGSWVMTRRRTTYTVRITSCKVDDPTDGSGVTDNTYCPMTGGTGGGGGGGGGGGTNLGVNLLGLSITLNGSLTNSLCALLAANPLDPIFAAGGPLGVTPALLGLGVSVSVCTAGPPLGVDDYPDDLTRVSAAVSWSSSNHTRSVVQTTLVPNPGT